MSDISLLGPLTVQIKSKVKFPATLVEERHLAVKQSFFYGGSLVRTARLLKKFGFGSNIVSYAGNDEWSRKIEGLMNEDALNHKIQRIPDSNTPFELMFYDKFGTSSYTLQIRELMLWMYRLKPFTGKDFVYLHPAIPSSYQKDIIANASKNTTFILRKPLDNDFDVFSFENRKLIIILNEWEAFRLFSETSRTYFNAPHFLQSKFLKNHTVLVESAKTLYSTSESDNILSLDFGKRNNTHSILNDDFLAVLIMFLVSKKNYLLSFKCALVAALRNFDDEFSFIDILHKAQKFEWETFDFDEGRESNFQESLVDMGLY